MCLAFDIDLKMGTLCTVAGWGNILEDGDLGESTDMAINWWSTQKVWAEVFAWCC